MIFILFQKKENGLYADVIRRRRLINLLVSVPRNGESLEINMQPTLSSLRIEINISSLAFKLCFYSSLMVNNQVPDFQRELPVDQFAANVSSSNAKILPAVLKSQISFFYFYLS